MISELYNKEAKEIFYLKNLYIPEEYKYKPLNRGYYDKIRTSSKISRNEYCPCNSGLKYKKCCINK